MKMKILITGHKGFIGSNLYKHFNLIPEFEILGYDIKDVPMEPEVVPINNTGPYPDIVFHLGAVSSTTGSATHCIQQNLEFSQRLFNSCNENGIDFFYASSAGVYGDKSFTEDGPIAPSSNYAMSKALFDNWVKEQETDIRVYGFRYFNVYGDGEQYKGEQASVFHKWKVEDNITLFEGSKDIKRDFIHVDDVCDIMEQFIMSPAPNGVYNIGTGRATSFESIANTFHERYQRTADAIPKKIHKIPMPEKFKKHYQYYTRADLTKLKKHVINPDFAFQDPIDYVETL